MKYVRGFLIGLLLFLASNSVGMAVTKALKTPFKAPHQTNPTKPHPGTKKAPVRLYWAEARQLSAKEIRCLALNIYHEARGEIRVGQVAVGQITFNRSDSGFGNRTGICATVHAPGQFSWTSDLKKRRGKPTGEAWEDALDIAQEVTAGLRVKGLEHSLYFHSIHLGRPAWTRSLIPQLTLGQHIYLAHEH